MLDGVPLATLYTDSRMPGSPWAYTLQQARLCLDTVQAAGLGASLQAAAATLQLQVACQDAGLPAMLACAHSLLLRAADNGSAAQGVSIPQEEIMTEPQRLLLTTLRRLWAFQGTPAADQQASNASVLSVLPQSPAPARTLAVC